MMKIKFLLGYVLLSCCLAPNLRAQDTSFWFVAPHMSEVTAGPANIPLNRPAFLAISNGTFQAATVTITRYNGANTSLVNTVSIAAGELYKLDFTTAAEMKTIENPRGQAGNVTEFGIHIESDVRVTAYYMLNHTESRDIFTLKGNQALGTQFYVPMQSDNAAKSNGAFGGLDQIDIVATEDNTVVTVVPKARIRLGASTLSPAGNIITRTLNKGETLKIIEYGYDENPSLAGTSITSTKPIAVTVTEDLVAGDTSGDQIVPVASLGTRYIVPRGFLTSGSMERFYLVGTEAGTTVKIYATAGATTPTQTISLIAGQTTRYTFPSAAYAVYVEADKPVYIYQRSGYGEEGAALLPSVYSIGQTKLSFFQTSGYGTLVQKGFIIFRDGTQSGFTVKHGSGAATALASQPGFTIYPVPNVPEWKVARFDFNAAPSAGQVIRVESAQSAFVLGYITGNITNNDSYGYFSAFGEFQFAGGDTTYMCGSSVTLEGGYARSYLWTYPDGVTTAITSSVTVAEEGKYTLVMDQDPNIVTASTYVKRVNVGTVSPASQQHYTGTIPGQLTVSGASELVGTVYQWQSSTDNVEWTNISGATLAAYAPGALYQTTWYRRGMSSELCGMAYTDGVKITILPRLIPVNPHLRTRVM
jgi:hypothetical protein